MSFLSVINIHETLFNKKTAEQLSALKKANSFTIDVFMNNYTGLRIDYMKQSEGLRFATMLEF